MSDVIYIVCTSCAGTGITPAHMENGVLIPESPCSACNGTGKKTGSQVIDLSTADNGAQTDIAALRTEVLAELDYIHGKVTAIWNQVKPS